MKSTPPAIADARDNAHSDITSMTWKPGRRGKKAEYSTLVKLNSIFKRWTPKLTSLAAKRALVRQHSLDTQVGNLVGMGQSVWDEYIQYRRPHKKKNLPEQVMKLFDSFVEAHYVDKVEQEDALVEY